MKEIVLENEVLKLTVLPELGGKFGSLIGKANGREHLLQPPEFERRPAQYGDPFDQYDTSGFDECFPTVGACQMADGSRVPDHGELWSVPWKVTAQSDTSLAMEVAGTVYPYLFERRVELQGEDVVLTYKVTNNGPAPFPYLWSSHPLLRVEPGDRLELPSEVRTVTVEWSAGDRLAGQLPWTAELAQLGPLERGWADKLFTSALQEGWCRVVYSDGGSLTYSFPTDQVPYLGLWICQGGWPTDQGRKRHYTVALEPCTGPLDRLDQAVERGCGARKLEPGQRVGWKMSLKVRSAAERGHQNIRVAEQGVGG